MRKRAATAIGVAGLSIAAVLTPLMEGSHNKVYIDPVGVATVCDGVTGAHIKPGQIYTDAECAEMNRAALEDAAATVQRHVRVKIDPYTEAALISFVYNLGAGNFASSTLLRKLNAGDIEGACNELPRWVYAGGKKLRGLVKRRREERYLCLRGYYRSQTIQYDGEDL